MENDGPSAPPAGPLISRRGILIAGLLLMLGQFLFAPQRIVVRVGLGDEARSGYIIRRVLVGTNPEALIFLKDSEGGGIGFYQSHALEGGRLAVHLGITAVLVALGMALVPARPPEVAQGVEVPSAPERPPDT